MGAHCLRVLLAVVFLFLAASYKGVLCEDAGAPEATVSAPADGEEADAENAGQEDADEATELKRLFSRIAELIQHGDFEEAAGALDEVAAMSPTGVESGTYHYYRAELYRVTDQEELAQAEYLAASGLETEKHRLSNAFFHMAEHHALLEETGEAIRLMRRAAELIPNAGWRQMQVGHFMRSLGLADDALAYFKAAAELSDAPMDSANGYRTLADYYRQAGNDNAYLDAARGYVNATRTLLDTMSESDKGLRVFFQGESYAARGDANRAYKAFQRAAEHPLDNFRMGECLMNMAEFERGWGMLDQAREHALKSGEILDDQPWKKQQLGYYFLRFGDLKEAERFFNEYLESNPADKDKASVYIALADANKIAGEREIYHFYANLYIGLVSSSGYQQTDDDERRRADYMQDIFGEQEQSASAAERLPLGDLSGDWGEGDGVEPDAVSLKNLRSLFVRAEGHIQQNEFERAASLLDEIGSLELDNVQRGAHLFYRAQLFERMGIVDAASVEYAAAAELIEDKPLLSMVYYRLADYHAKKGDMEQAYAYAGRSLELQPELSWKRLQIGNLYLQLNRMKEAVGQFDLALTLAASPNETMAALAAGADARKRIGDKEGYLARAREFIDLTGAAGESLSKSDSGLRAYFQGEVFGSEGNLDAADRAYREAATLVGDKFRLADIYMKLAGYARSKNRSDEAAAYVLQSAELLPDQGWKLEQAGAFFHGIGMSERTIDLFKSRLPNALPQIRALLLAGLAETYRRMGDKENFAAFARQYAQELSESGRELSEYEQGLSAYYEAEAANLDGDFDAAIAAYERAAGLTILPDRLAEIHLRLAECERQRGDLNRAADHAEKSASYLPDQAWKQTQIANFLVNLGLPERATGFLEAQLEAALTEKDKLVITARLAESYKNIQNNGAYLDYARKYIGLADSIGVELSDDDKGTLAYYRAETLAADKNIAAAAAAYREASLLIAEPYRLSDIYMKLALFERSLGNRTEAAVYAEKSAQLLPDQPWKLDQIGNFFLSLDMPGEAFEYYDRYLALATTDEQVASVYQAMAEAYRRAQDYDKYHDYAQKYIDLVMADGRLPSDDERGRSAFYQAEIYVAADKIDLANDWYEIASRYVPDTFRLSEIFMNLAKYQSIHGTRDKAVDYIERSTALLPNQAWRLMEAGNLYLSMDMMEDALRYYKRVVENADTLGNRASACIALAEVYLRLGNKTEYYHYAGEYIKVIAERKEKGDKVSDGEEGLRAYYQAERHAMDEFHDRALEEYLTAFDLLTDKDRQSNIAMKIATYLAIKEQNDDAREWAVKAADLLPNEMWKQMQVADFFLDLGDLETAIFYYRRAIAVSSNAAMRGAALIAMAEAYRKMEDIDSFVKYAREYLEIMLSREDSASPQEQGMVQFYIGEIHTAMEAHDAAYCAYERASLLLTEKYRLADVLLKMAEYNIKDRRNPELAVEQALRVAELQPGDIWRIRNTVKILVEARRIDLAIRVIESTIALDPDVNGELYRDLAQIFFANLERKNALHYNRLYIDYLYDMAERSAAKRKQAGEVEAADEEAYTREERQLWDARQYQQYMARTWGLDSYLFTTRQANGDYYIGTLHDLFRSFRLRNGMTGKVYAKFGGTLNARYSGSSYDSYFNEMRNWTARSRFNETTFAKFGVEISPFKKSKWLTPISFRLEYHLGIGKNTEDDVLGHIIVDRSVGLDLRPFGNYWHFWKIYSDTAYSFRRDYFTSSGNLRQGIVFRAPFDRNLLVVPFATVRYDYAGRNVDASKQWNLASGVGIALRRWYRENRYRTPQSYIDVDITYTWGLTKNQENMLGINLSHSF